MTYDPSGSQPDPAARPDAAAPTPDAHARHEQAPPSPQAPAGAWQQPPTAGRRAGNVPPQQTPEAPKYGNVPAQASTGGYAPGPHYSPAPVPHAGPQPAAAPQYAAPHQYAAAAPTGQPGYPAATSNKSFIATWLFALLLGMFGIDRFYLGKIGTGIVKLITFGGVGVWWLIDLILVLAGATRDRAGSPLEGYAKHRKVAWIITGAVLALSLILNAVEAAVGGTAPSQLSSNVESTTAPVAIETEAPVATVAAPVETQAPVEQAPAWADTQFGTFAPEDHSGVGDSMLTLPAGVSAGLVTATHEGAANFAIIGLDASNQNTGELLVNAIGSYSGSTAWGISGAGDTVTLQVMADGPWTITLSPLSAAPQLGTGTSGAGDAVFLYDGSSAGLAATHDGEANFIVIEETGKSYSFGLLVNTIGAYSGTVPLSSGPSVITVQADGNWTLAVG